MRWIRALAPLTLAVAVTACGGAPLADGSGSAEQSSAPDDSSGEPPASSTSAAPSTGAPSDGGSAVGEGCDERMLEHSDAATTLSLTWESINYQVLDDAGWQEQVAQDWVDAAAYRAAAELLQDVPDYEDDSDRGVWSTYAADALALAALLDQAAASGTPFADGIGQQIRDQASELQSGAGTLVHFTVDHMCDDPADEVSTTGVDELLALLVPPNSTEIDRITSPTFSTFSYISTESLDALESYYPGAIADTGWDVFWTDAIGEGTYWDVQGATGFRWQVTIQPAEGSGTEVKIDFYGES